MAPQQEETLVLNTKKGTIIQTTSRAEQPPLEGAIQGNFPSHFFYLLVYQSATWMHPRYQESSQSNAHNALPVETAVVIPFWGQPPAAKT